MDVTELRLHVPTDELSSILEAVDPTAGISAQAVCAHTRR
jgi:hypothetical protein